MNSRLVKVLAVGAASIATVLASSPSWALGYKEGNISCTPVAKVQSRTSGDTYVKPPAEGDRYIGTFSALTTKTTFESYPNDGKWDVLSSEGIDYNATFAACTQLPW